MQNDGILLIDACPKSRNDSNFNRPWPNVIVMDEQTIKDVDEKWVNSIPFPFTESPSLRFKKLVKNPGAVAKV
jgi:4-hydroxy-3-polyprenylbenzoate decarboxylase